jgi:site-specific DNA-methyltransferase (adenine-specific)
VIHDGSDEVMEAFAAFGDKVHSAGHARDKLVTTDYNATSYNMSGTVNMRRLGDSGSAARFFYCAKAGAEDRWGSRHPTVKPVELIRYLVKLVCPPGGTFLDPFAGSGTAGVAALAEGRNAILIEQDVGYIADICKRMAHYEGDGRHSLASKQRNAASRERPGTLL